MKSFDIFISHSSDDKDAFVRALSKALQKAGLNIWYDEFNLKIGDSIRKSIDNGLRKSKYAVIVVSKSFMQKSWTNWELNGLLAREMNEREMVLPIWHRITHEDLIDYSPSLADKFALNSDMKLSEIVNQLVERVKPELIESNTNHGVLLKTVYDASVPYLGVSLDKIESILRETSRINSLYFSIQPGETMHEWGSGGERETIIELNNKLKMPMIILKHTDYWSTASDDSMDHALPSRIIIQSSSDDKYGVIEKTVRELINMIEK